MKHRRGNCNFVVIGRKLQSYFCLRTLLTLPINNQRPLIRHDADVCKCGDETICRCFTLFPCANVTCCYSCVHRKLVTHAHTQERTCETRFTWNTTDSRKETHKVGNKWAICLATYCMYEQKRFIILNKFCYSQINFCGHIFF